MTYDKLRTQMREYYKTMANPEHNPEFVRVRDAIKQDMDAYADSNPGASADTLKRVSTPAWRRAASALRRN